MGKKKWVDYDPTTGIFIKHNYRIDEPLAKAICKNFFFVKKVADLGCGDGRYCKYYSDNGWEVHGYEGNKNAIKNKIYDDIERVDLSKDVKFKSKYDLTISLEVGEHIPKEFQNVFINNITKISKKYILLSWAIPTQGGKGHVNCLPNETIIKIFKDKGFVYDKLLSNFLRDSSTFKFFKNTIMVFEKEK